MPSLRQRAGGSAQDLAVVGMFRSNTRKGLSLDPEDAAFFAERFPIRSRWCCWCGRSPPSPA